MAESPWLMMMAEGSSILVFFRCSDRSIARFLEEFRLRVLAQTLTARENGKDETLRCECLKPSDEKCSVRMGTKECVGRKF